VGTALMPDLTSTEDRNTSVKPETSVPDEAKQIGVYSAFDWTPEPHYMSEFVLVPDEFEDTDERDLSPLSEDARKALLDIDQINSKTDVAPRRIEIEQTWKADHYDRGYQFLLHHRNGGWTMPGIGTGFGADTQKKLTELYHTNIYGEKGEIIVAALSRDVPKVEFFPANPDHAPDQDMAFVSDDLKDIWAKNNDLHCLVRDAAKIFWNEDRCLFWTRYELNGEEYGYEDPDEPVVPENEENPPTEPTNTAGSVQYQEENKSPSPTPAPRKPRGRVITTALGKLDHKVPIYVNDIKAMPCVQICEDLDISVVRAKLPWMKEKVHGGGDAVGEVELDRIARENVRQAVPGQYVTGDALNRHCVVKHSYIRRSSFFDPLVSEDVREELLAKFPDGVLLVKAATEFAFARNECIDDHLEIGHPFPGNGQNRRSLGESLLPIQDYVNELISLALDFAKRTVAKKWMDSEAFNIEALKTQTNIPGTIGPFQRQPGVPAEELIFIEPTPTPQPWMITWIQWCIGALAEQITGALPSLFGAAISGQVGSEGVAIQRDQAMQRVGCPWNSLQSMFATAARQAVMLTARCANKDIADVIPGKGRVSIKLNNLKGSVLCYPEANPEFPESWAQRETRIMSLVDHALASPSSGISQMILDPRNLQEIQSSLRLKNFKIKGADSVLKQEAEFEILLRSGPVPNPAVAQMGSMLAQAQAGMAEAGQRAQMGAATPEEQQQLQAAPQMLDQLQKQMQSMPQQISTVPIRGDGSEDDEVEASVCFDWMNGPDGRKFEHGTPEQQASFANVHLHWSEHDASDKKRKAALAPPPPPPRVSFSVPADKMPPTEQAAIITAGGIPANPADFEEHNTIEMNRDIVSKVVPDQLYTQGLHKPPAPATPGKKPPVQ
jgi:hypothetical protein